MIIDIHTHHSLPAPLALRSCSVGELPAPQAFPGQLYSVGFHPWDLTDEGIADEQWEKFEEALHRPDVAAVGEAGIDLSRGPVLFRQRELFRRQAEAAERVGKPLVIHCVRAQEHIIGYHKELRPKVPWVIHGFRGKPTVAEMFLREGLWLSFGPQFNPDSLLSTPLDWILAETDDSPSTIEDILMKLRQIRPQLTGELIAENTLRLGV